MGFFRKKSSTTTTSADAKEDESKDVQPTKSIEQVPSETKEEETGTETYLVLSATGRQGSAVINALIAKGVKSIVGSSRNPESDSCKKLLELDEVTKIVKADFYDTDSITNAIVESGASRLWFATDFWSIPFHKKTRETEAMLGSNVINAITKASSIKHVVYSSVGKADECADNIRHFMSKADVEKYMKSQFDADSGITWSIIRPYAFFENTDDPNYWNPLKKGNVKMLLYPDKSMAYIACADIGKGSAALLIDAEEHAGKTIEAASTTLTGDELAEALTEASGTECTFSIALPRSLLWMVNNDLYNMVEFIELGGSMWCDKDAKFDEFKKLVPDAMDAKDFFDSKGKWGDGEVFESKKETTESKEEVPEES